MSLTAEFRLGSHRLPLVDVADAVPDVTLQLENGEQPTSGPFVLFIRATGASFDGIESALDRSPWVQEFFLISDTNMIRIYQIVTTSRRPSPVEELRLGKTHLESVNFLANGWQMSQQFADRAELATFRDSCEEMNISFHLDRLYDSTSTDMDLIGVTEKQREALLTAYEMGYFAVPRKASMAAVAAAIDISLPALAERLHRAESHLIEHFFYSVQYNTPDSSRHN